MLRRARLAISRWIGSQSEPTIEEILSDSIVKAVMEADGVDPRALEAKLRSMARRTPAIHHADPMGAPGP